MMIFMQNLLMHGNTAACVYIINRGLECGMQVIEMCSPASIVVELE